MINEIKYTSIRRVLDNIMDHPMLRDLTLEQTVRYTLRFIGINGFPQLYQNKTEAIEIHEFRGELPCDLIGIVQVRDFRTGVCLRSMTDTFPSGINPDVPCSSKPIDLPNNAKQQVEQKDWYIPPKGNYVNELSYKVQGRILYTSFPEGMIEIAYKSIPIDEDGFPLLIDNENYLAALEAYIKKQVFTIKFEQSKIPAAVLQNAQTEYAWLAGQLSSEMLIPSLSEMQSITNMYNSLLPKMNEFYKGFKTLGSKEVLIKH